MNKVLVMLYVPVLEARFEVWIPVNKKVGIITIMLIKALNEMSGGYYNNAKKMALLYNKNTAKKYDINQTIKQAGIRNGTEIVLM